LIEGRRVFGLPSAGHEFPSDDPLGWRTNFRFDSLRVWDFREIELPDRDPLIVWGERPLPWPG
jgi:hypothetical protein